MTKDQLARLPELQRAALALYFVNNREPDKINYDYLYDQASRQHVLGRMPDKGMLVKVLDLLSDNTERMKKEADQYLTGRLTDVREKMQAVDDKLNTLFASVLQDYVELALERNKPKKARLEAIPIEVLKGKYLRLSDRLREMRTLIALAIPGEQAQAPVYDVESSNQPINQPTHMLDPSDPYPMIKRNPGNKLEFEYFVSYKHSKGNGWSTISRSKQIEDGDDLEGLTKALLKGAQEDNAGIEWLSLISVQRLPI